MRDDGNKRERERERDDGYFGSSTAPLLGGLCRPLASGGSRGVNLDCNSRGAYPVAPAVLESHIRRHWFKRPRRALNRFRNNQQGQVRSTTPLTATEPLQELQLGSF